jgi:hypothetical protein
MSTLGVHPGTLARDGAGSALKQRSEVKPRDRAQFARFQQLARGTPFAPRRRLVV